MTQKVVKWYGSGQMVYGLCYTALCRLADVSIHIITSNDFYLFSHFAVREMHVRYMRAEHIHLLVMVWLLGNAHTLNLVDTALFCLVFEDSDSVDPFKLSRLFLCGDAASRLLITAILNDV